MGSDLSSEFRELIRFLPLPGETGKDNTVKRDPRKTPIINSLRL